MTSIEIGGEHPPEGAIELIKFLEQIVARADVAAMRDDDRAQIENSLSDLRPAYDALAKLIGSSKHVTDENFDLKLGRLIRAIIGIVGFSTISESSANHFIAKERRAVASLGGAAKTAQAQPRHEAALRAIKQFESDKGPLAKIPVSKQAVVMLTYVNTFLAAEGFTSLSQRTLERIIIDRIS